MPAPLPKVAHDAGDSRGTTPRTYWSRRTVLTVRWTLVLASQTATTSPRYQRLVPSGSHTCAIAAGLSPSSGVSTTIGPGARPRHGRPGPRAGRGGAEREGAGLARYGADLDGRERAGRAREVRRQRAGRLLDERVGAVLVGQADGHDPVRVDHAGDGVAVVVVEDGVAVPAGQRVAERAELAETAAVTPPVALEGDGRADDGRRGPGRVGGDLGRQRVGGARPAGPGQVSRIGRVRRPSGTVARGTRRPGAP